MAKDRGYLGNQNLKQIGEMISFTPEMVSEYIKCSKDPIYFLETYGKIISIDKGIIPFKLYPYQKRIVLGLKDNRKVISKLFRQSGKSTVVAGFIAWFVLFNDNKECAILANKMATAKEIFSRVQFIIESCPKWLQQGVKEWNKTSFELENGSGCFASATSASAIRGRSLAFLLLDEFGFLSSGLADEFIASVFPTISSSKTSKIAIVSTPKGMNHFYKMWMEAESGVNGFIPIEAHWTENPDRDQEWADEQLSILGDIKFNAEVLCQFAGSSNTLINGEKVASLPFTPPKYLIPNNETLVEFEEPIANESYVMTVDVSRGANLDYSTFTVIKISSLPYKVVCRFRDNKVSTLVFPEIIHKIAKGYNDAFVLIETNDLGQQVADALYYDLEYENVYMSTRDKVSEGGGSKMLPGLRTTKKTKSIGCDLLKGLIENDKLEVNDIEIISEMSVFVRVGASYKAEDTKHDDLMMCLVMFAYLTSQPVFKDLFDFSLREKFFEEQLRQVEEQMLPIGFVNRGNSLEEIEPIVTQDLVWIENDQFDDYIDTRWEDL